MEVSRGESEDEEDDEDGIDDDDEGSRFLSSFTAEAPNTACFRNNVCIKKSVSSSSSSNDHVIVGFSLSNVTP
jgi:hypothetical protein